MIQSKYLMFMVLCFSLLYLKLYKKISQNAQKPNNQHLYSSEKHLKKKQKNDEQPHNTVLRIGYYLAHQTIGKLTNQPFAFTPRTGNHCRSFFMPDKKKDQQYRQLLFYVCTAARNRPTDRQSGTTEQWTGNNGTMEQYRKGMRPDRVVWYRYDIT